MRTLPVIKTVLVSFIWSSTLILAGCEGGGSASSSGTSSASSQTPTNGSSSTGTGTTDGGSSGAAPGTSSGTVAVSVNSLTMFAPQISMIASPNSFSVAAPASQTITNAVWNFGDGSATQSGLSPISYIYRASGSYQVSVDVTYSTGQQVTLAQLVTVMPYDEESTCVSKMSDSVPTSATTGIPINVSALVPSCISLYETSTVWNFGDGSSGALTPAATHTYANPGIFTIVFTVADSRGVNPTYTLKQSIVVTEPSAPTTPICSPFSGNGGLASSASGIQATITYLPLSSPVIAAGLNVESFTPGATDVQAVPGSVLLNQFNIVTQDFSDGFQLADGSYVKDLTGAKLTQYFAIRSEGEIGLAPSATTGSIAPGYYQFAVLADDGAVFKVTDGAGTAIEVNDDGTHSNELACAPTAALLSAGHPMSFSMNYYQGPLDRLGLMLLWRPVDANNASELSEPFCDGQAMGDNYFFANDANGVPQPTANFEALLSRGWKVVPNGNFYLPNGVTNSCQ